MVLAILVFNFYPVTAVMIVLIAVLNDGAILSIAYDNVHYKDEPEAWNMRLVLGIATVLGIVGPIAAFGLFYLGNRVLHLGHPELQTLMYLLLSVAGHLTIFLTRTRGPFWSIRPARILLIAVLGTQAIATLIAVYGLFMTPIGWKLAGIVWGYAIVWALLTDRVKLLGYRVLDHVKADVSKPEDKVDAKPDAKAGAPKSEAKAELKPKAKADAPKPEAKADQPKPEAKVEPKPEAKADVPKPEAKADQPKPEDKDEPKPEAKADAPKPEAKADQPKPEAKTSSDLTPQIAERAYELYGERAGNDGTAVQDWKKAEQEIRNDEVKGEPKPVAKADAPTPEDKVEPNAEVKANQPAPEAKANEPKPEAKDEPQPDVTPQLVKRVHELYEQLGREDVKAVQDWEKAEPELQETKSRR